MQHVMVMKAVVQVPPFLPKTYLLFTAVEPAIHHQHVCCKITNDLVGSHSLVGSRHSKAFQA